MLQMATWRRQLTGNAEDQDLGGDSSWACRCPGGGERWVQGGQGAWVWLRGWESAEQAEGATSGVLSGPRTRLLHSPFPV